MPSRSLKVLSISDKVISALNSEQNRQQMGDIDCVIACGDLPYYYQEQVAKKLRVPLYFVRGNHDSIIEYGVDGERTAPRNGIDLHRRVLYQDGIIFAGIEGCNRYNRGDFQYTQLEMWEHVFRLVPTLLLNRMRYGRYLDIFITHAAPQGIHDKPDWTHRGIKAFNWLIKIFKPKYHFHGHNHVYTKDTITETQVGKTLVVNTYGYKLKELKI